MACHSSLLSHTHTLILMTPMYCKIFAKFFMEIFRNGGQFEIRSIFY